MVFTVAEAKSRLPEILKLVEKGTPVTITRRGIPVAELITPRVTPRKRRFGIFGDRSPIVDPNWDRPQNDLDAWLAGDV